MEKGQPSREWDFAKKFANKSPADHKDFGKGVKHLMEHHKEWKGEVKRETMKDGKKA